MLYIYLIHMWLLNVAVQALHPLAPTSRPHPLLAAPRPDLPTHPPAPRTRVNRKVRSLQEKDEPEMDLGDEAVLGEFGKSHGRELQ